VKEAILGQKRGFGLHSDVAAVDLSVFLGVAGGDTCENVSFLWVFCKKLPFFTENSELLGVLSV